MRPVVTVVTPVFEAGDTLDEAVASLRCQTEPRYQHVLVDDGSRDRTPRQLQRLRGDGRTDVVVLPRNCGLGAALNHGLECASAEIVAYLPADDLFAAEHLRTLLDLLHADGAVAAVAGVRHHGDRHTLGPVPEAGLQLVQVAHRRTAERWTERDELETDDLERLFWGRLRRHGHFVRSRSVTCTWRDHPRQRHKLMRESHDGGLNVFRSRYRIADPLRFRSTDGGEIDEVALYRRFRRRSRPFASGLRILLVGELGFNPERVVALEERGHRLAGLWITDPLADSAVGPLPFGNVVDLPQRDWREAVAGWRPDVVYGLLNWRAVPLVREVLDAGLDVPVVWHFKEAPQRCRLRGTWEDLARLHRAAAAVLYTSEVERDWFTEALPDARDPATIHVLDGDLPKADWLWRPRSERLSDADGEVHTVVVGRPVGIDEELVAGLARRGVHVHFHGLVRARHGRDAWDRWLAGLHAAGPGYVHTHPRLDQRGWVRGFSVYDAAGLHPVRSENGGDLARASWDDLNQPARVATCLAAGLPLLQPRSPGSRVAMQELVTRTGAGLLYTDLDELAGRLHDHPLREAAARAAWEVRGQFTFDAHVVGETAPDVVHANLIDPASNGLLLDAAVGHAAAALATCHMTGTLLTGDEQHRLAKSYGRLDAVVAPSHEIQDLLTRGLGLPRHHVRQVHNGVPPGSEVTRAPREEVSICAVGRLTSQKGFDVLLAAVRRLVDGGRRLSVVIVGEGRDRAVLEAAAVGLPVRFVGFREDVRPWLENCDVFCLPSRAEALPLALLEAMMTGAACVTTAVGEIPAALCVHGRAGPGAVGDVVEVVPPDDVGALARVLEALVDDPGRRRWLGRRASQRAHQRHDVRRTAAEVRGIHDDVLSARAAMAVAQ